MLIGMLDTLACPPSPPRRGGGGGGGGGIGGGAARTGVRGDRTKEELRLPTLTPTGVLQVSLPRL